jgi:predicted O-linked N-acetylglucosamine transferase (SPINDLY family)
VTKFITAAIEHHDREHWDLFCYSDAEKPDEVTAKLKKMVGHWQDTRGLSDATFEKVIRNDRIDILIDLRGHAADNRLTLFARKPAPVQATMVGYFNTTGLSDHYRITDAQMDPPGLTEHLHTETLVRLPHSCWCYTPDESAPDVTEPPALKNGFVTFGSLNKIVKVSEPCARLWARVLEAVPGSRLLLSVAGEDAMGPVRDRLASYGLPPDRLDILGKTSGSRQYLERFSQIDVALDTFPFNGITTTCEGLWMGVPCVSLAGDTSVSRASWRPTMKSNS